MKKTALFYSVLHSAKDSVLAEPGASRGGYSPGVCLGSLHQTFKVRIHDTKVGGTIGSGNTSQAAYDEFLSKEVI